MKLFPLFLVAIILGATPLQAQPTNMNDETLSKFIENYLLQNPNVLIKAIDNAQQYAFQKAELKKAEILTANKQAIFNDKRDFSIGPSDAKINLAEFFDYNCGYCKRALPGLLKLIENNKDIRVTFKELPILGPSSTQAAKIALTAPSNEAYLDIHNVLLNNKGSLNTARLQQIAQKHGINDAASQKQRTSTAIEKHLTDTQILAQRLDIKGTPAFIVGETIMRGAQPYETLQAAVDQLRKDLN